jgi:aryl-alcohol dehydrogenase-like predicted oxidoreductase
MLFRSLGDSQIALSSISLGTWKYREGETDSSALSKLFQMAFENGVNYFDTAVNYDNGNAEKFIGSLWNSINRSKVIVGTKCYFPTSNSPEDKGLSRYHIHKCVNTSLKNLNTDYIDLFQCHRWDSNIPIEETISAMNELIQQGKIRFWGLGAATGSQVAEAVLKSKLMNCSPPVSHQHVYNMFNRTAEFEVLDTGKRMGVGFLAYSPLAQGVLSGKYSATGSTGSGRASDSRDVKGMWDFTPDKIEKASKLAKLANNYGISTATYALAWCLRTKLVTSTITSVSNENQLRQNLAAAEIDISDSLDEAYRIMNNDPYNIYTQASTNKN